MVELLFSGKGSLVVLGDDDQSIYRFRYNHPRGIQDFIDRWRDRDLDLIALPANHRSGKDIVGLANLMMAEAGSTKAPMNPARDEAGSVAVMHWPSLEDEIAGLARYMKLRIETFLVLAPRRFIGHRLQRAIGDDARTSFHQEDLEHALVQERFALASLLADPADRVALRAWFGFDGRSWTQADSRNADAYASLALGGRSANEVFLAIKSGELTPRGLGQLNVQLRAARFDELQKNKPEGLMPLVKFLFDPDLAQQISTEEARLEAEASLADLHAASAVMIDEGASSLAAIIETLRYRIATRTALVLTEKEPRVKIMTLHSAKGLEADTVVMLGLADQIIPGLPDDDPDEDAQTRAEQRRLLYVAITRARNVLLVSWPLTADYTDASQNYIRHDRVFTEDGARRTRLGRSHLLPNGLPRPTPGAAFLKQFGL